MDKCEKCLYKENCQFLATHKKAIVADCTAYKDATNVVEVVRCKDCYLRNTEACPFCFWDCGELMGYTEDNDFCSYGERKE